MNKCIERLQNYSAYFDFFYGNGINNKIFPQEFFPIVGLFAMDCRYKLRECYFQMNRLFVSGVYRGEKCSLVLRIIPNEDIGLVISAVQFVHRRNGNLTRLIEILEDIRKTTNLGEIIIENVVSLEMESWVNNKGWTAIDQSSRNYISKEGIKRYYKKHGITWR